MYIVDIRIIICNVDRHIVTIILLFTLYVFKSQLLLSSLNLHIVIIFIIYIECLHTVAVITLSLSHILSTINIYTEYLHTVTIVRRHLIVAVRSIVLNRGRQHGNSRARGRFCLFLTQLFESQPHSHSPTPSSRTINRDIIISMTHSQIRTFVCFLFSSVSNHDDCQHLIKNIFRTFECKTSQMIYNYKL